METASGWDDDCKSLSCGIGMACFGFREADCRSENGGSRSRDGDSRGARMETADAAASHVHLCWCS